MSEALKMLGHHLDKYAEPERSVMDDLCGAFIRSRTPLAQRLQTFPRHVRRQDIARFLARHEIFKLSLPANGSIVECGVFAGGGLMSWAHFSAIYEPYNHTRRVIGFDTFKGFPEVHGKDFGHGISEHAHAGAFQTADNIQAELQSLIKIHDRNRPLGHIPKIDLVAGNATETIPNFVDGHPHMLVSLLYLDFDIYEPTKVALDTFLPRIVKG